jgi:tetrahydromethanopterin S-methyltransferase subunit A
MKPVIRATYDGKKEWHLDPKGFFTIMPFPEDGLIRARYYNSKHELVCTLEGKSAEEIYNTIVKKEMVSLLSHAAYLGSELQKAEIALRKKIQYVQDQTLKL